MNVNQSAAPKRDWTCLYYLNGQGSLREEMTRHLTRLHNEGSSHDVYAVADLYRSDYQLTSKTALHWFADKLGLEKNLDLQVNQDWRGCGTFVIRETDQSHDQTVRTSFVETDQQLPSQWQTLRDFLVDSMNKYPSEHVSLTVATHSNGSDRLLSDCSGQSMSVADFKKAIEQAEVQTGREIDVLTLESCRMGNQEVIDQLHEVVPFIIASPELIRAGEAPHAEVLHQLKENPTMSPQQLATTIEGKFADKLAGMTLFA